MATTGDLTSLSNDVYNASGAPAGWTRIDDFPGFGGFYGAVYRNTNGEIFAVMRGMELSLLDQAAVAQVEFGIKPLAFNSAVDFYRDVTRDNRFGNTVTFVGHSLGGAMVDYIAAVAASESTRVTGITFGAIGIASILSSEGLNGTNLNDRLTNYVHPLDIAKTIGTRVGTQVEVPYTRGWIDNLGSLFGLIGLFGEPTRQHAIQSYQQSFNAQGTLTLSSSHLLDMLAVTATSGNGDTTYTVNSDNSVTVVTREFQAPGLIKTVQTSQIRANGNVSSTTVDANNNVTATSTATVNQADQSVTIVRKNFNGAGQVESEGTMRLDKSGRATITASGDGFSATVNNTIVTIQPGAQANINADGSYILSLANSTVQTTTFNSTLVTASGGSTNLINLGSNNNLVLGRNTTVDMRGNNNTIIGPVPPNTTNSGTGNTSLSAALLPANIAVSIRTSTGFRGTIDEEDGVHVLDGGSDGGSFDDTSFGPGPDPLDEGGSGGGSGDPGIDPMINGHAFIVAGDFEIVAGGGNNSIEGGLNKNIIVVDGGNNAVNAAGTENIVVASGGNNIIGVGGGISTVSVDGGVNIVSDFSQNGIVMAEGNLIMNFGVGNHTILAGSGPALSPQDFPGFIPDTGIPFSNVIRGNANFYADIQGLVSNLIIGGPNGNYIQGGLGDNTIYGGESADQLIGGMSHYLFGGRSVIYGGGGNDVIEGGVGGEAELFGDAGNDTLRGGDSRATLHGGAGNDTLLASSNFDSILYGDQGDDLLTVGVSAGNVRFDGGAGNDILIGNASTHLQTVVFGRGYDHDTFGGVPSRVIISMNAGVLPEDLTSQTNSHGDLFLSINGTDDVLGVGGYFLDGTYTITFADGTNWNKTTVESRTPGLVLSSALGGETLEGSTLADTLSGSGGNDTLLGGDGSDTYLVDLGNGVTSIGDGDPDDNNTLIFGVGITSDSVPISRTTTDGIILRYGTQGDEVHLLNFNPFDPIRSLGIQSIQFFDGTVWDTPTILSLTPGVVLSDTAGHGILQGSPLNDTLSGPGGNASLYGGAGNDTYLFDRGHGHVTVFDQDPSGNELNTIQLASSIAPTDVTLDLSPDGALLLNVGGTTDQVSLANFRERSYQSFQVSFADGTVWDRETLIAQIANFPIVADPEGSSLIGSDLSDTLIGLEGHDSLDGLSGADVMSGGGGNDLYYVEDQGDQVIELPGQGRDVVRSYIDYTLPDNVEDLYLSYSEFSGPIPTIGSGNSGNNVVQGNFQNNVLLGGAGDDTLFGGFTDVSFGPGNDELSGGTGSDTYYVDGLVGNGVDTIHDTASPGEGNRLQLGPSIRPSDLTFVQTSGSLFIGMGTAGDGVVLDNFDPTDAVGSMVLETISFTGGIEQPQGGFHVRLSDFLKPAIDGTAGNDVLTGTAEVDIVRSGSGNDVITGGQGNDVLIGGSGEDTYAFNLGDGTDVIDDIVQSGEVNRVLFGGGINSSSLRLEHSGQFNTGILTIHVGNAGDTLQFLNFEALSPTTTRAVDIFEFADGTTTTFDQLFLRGVEVKGTAGDDGELFGTFANDTILGLAGSESLGGDIGNDTLIGGAGNDFLYGGDGVDTYIYHVGDGRDEIEDDAEFVLDQDGNSVLANNRIFFGEGITLSDIDLTIADGPLFIKVGTTGAGLNLGPFTDVQLGIRTLAFHDGLTLNLPDLTDALLFSDADRVLTGGTGNSTVLGGNGNDFLTGGDGASVLVGWKGDDVLVGGTGPSKFYGGLGNDLLQGNTTTDDTYAFNRGDGTDRIQDTAGVGAGNRIQFGAGIVLGDLVFTQDQVADRLTIEVGTSGVDVIQLEDFTLSGTDGSVVTQTLAFQDGTSVQLADLLATPGQVIGTSSNDVLTGTSGNDTLTGGTGNDSLAGGAGDDTYVFNIGDGVDSIADTATPGEGNTLQFGPGITPEDLSLGLGSLQIRVGTNGDAVHLATFNPNDALGSHSIDRFRFVDGSSLSYAQLIARGFDHSGTSANDIINGTNVSDRIIGLSGDDSLFGGQGVDTLIGGLGNDTYSVDSLSDVVTELPNEGIDRVLSAVNYTLGSDLENLTLAGGSDINGTGNALNNVLVGNRGNNILDGGVGTDTMRGGVGHDTYVIDDLGDEVTENANEGTDTVRSSLSYTLGENVENLRLVGLADLNGTGNTLDNVLVGNEGNNVLTGGIGNDRLHGATGTDSLLGEQGDDTYRFDVGDGIDTIQDVATVGEGNRILFGTGITQANLSFIQNQTSPTLTIQVGTSGTDRLVLTNFDPTGANGSLVVETIAFADGSSASLTSFLGGSTNQAPTVATPLADQSALEDAAFTFTVPADTFADADLGDGLMYSASQADDSALPTWLSFDAATRTFSGMPANAQVGSLEVRVTATDTGELSVADTFTLTVQNINDAPTVAAPLVNQISLEDAPFSFVVPINIFTDQDTVNGDSLTYSASLANGSALPTWLSFNGATRTFSGTPLNGDVGNFNITVTATDSGGLSATSPFTLTVQNVNDAPTVTTPLADHTAVEDAAFTFTVPATTFADADLGDVLTYRATLADGTALPTWLSFDAATRTFTGTPANSEVGSLDVRITATDSDNLNTSDTFTLTVQNVNDAPTVTSPLVNQMAVEDAAFTFTVPINTFADVDAGETLTYSASLADRTALPSWLSFDATTRTFNGTPLNGNVGTLSLRVTVTDTRNLSASNTFSLTVTNVNDVPTVANPIADQAAGTGTAFTFTVAANAFADADVGDTLTYSATRADGTALPSWLTFNPMTRTFSGTPADSDAGVLNLKITATDGGNLSVADIFDMTVTIPNLTLSGTAGNDVLTGGSGHDQLFGLAGNDTLNGGAGNDLLDGGTGSDTMRGGTGNDTYLVNLSTDAVTENLNEGTDTVQSSTSYMLSANVEHLTLMGTSAINGVGNGLDNTLTGNSASNTLIGGAGHDTLNGGAGTDTLVGGTGNDTYVVGAGDNVAESDGNGTDTVQSSVTWTLGENLENLTLLGSAAINGTGNGYANVMIGNNAGNVLRAGGGADTLRGNGGNDTVNGGGGSDTYLFGRGEGWDLLQDNGGSADRVMYDAGISPLDLVISRQANDLRLSIHGSTDSVMIQNWYTSTANQTETIQAGNGQTLLSAQVDQLIQAMASFSQQSGLTWDQAIDQQPQDVQAVLAASWQS